MKLVDYQIWAITFFVICNFTVTICIPAGKEEAGLPSSPKKLSGDEKMLKEHPSLTRNPQGIDMIPLKTTHPAPGYVHITLGQNPAQAGKKVFIPKSSKPEMAMPHNDGGAGSRTVMTIDPKTKNLVYKNRGPMTDQERNENHASVSKAVKEAKGTLPSGTVSPRHTSPKKDTESIRMVRYDPHKETLVGYTRKPMTEQENKELHASVSKAAREARGTTHSGSTHSGSVSPRHTSPKRH